MRLLNWLYVWWGWLVLAITLVVLVMAMVMPMFMVSKIRQLENTVTVLEEHLKQRIRPIIQVQRATIYNTDGEVVVQAVDKGK